MKQCHLLLCPLFYKRAILHTQAVHIPMIDYEYITNYQNTVTLIGVYYFQYQQMTMSYYCTYL